MTNPWPPSSHSAQALPSGTVTFLFTDIEGSTKLAREHHETWETLRARHHDILRGAIESNNGYIFQIIGDAFCAAFQTAGDALRAAAKSQIDLHAENWDDAPIRVRMGIHTGKAEIQENGEYHGYLAMSRIQRLMSAGHGGQVLISAATQELLYEDLPEEVSLRDLGEHRLKDLVRPEHIYQLVSASLPADFPPIKSLDALPNNLPIQLTSFIGREKELGELKEQIERTRLLTLTGVGGTGKTRLALQVAADALDNFHDGVWLVELAPLSDPALVPQVVATTLGLREQVGREFLDTLKDYLARKNLLVVLDNCEHLIEACAQLADTLLHTAPHLQILATSREALGIAGESTYPVLSLSIPDTRQPLPENLSQYDAVRLFIQRAVAVQPNFQVTNQNAPAVAQICYRLDGIPLAIELAAARVKGLGVEQIAARLDDRFRLLTGGSRTALERHQTLRATIDWSYNLLLPNEQVLFRRLSVFVGGWTLEAAESVCSDASVKSDDVLDLLEHLINKSIVILEDTQGETRYHMLETLRQYANEKLVESGEIDALRDRQLDFFLQLAREVEPKLYGAEQVACLNWLEEELDNFRAALEWSLDKGAAESGIFLAGALWRFWIMRGYWSEGYEWLKRELSRKGSSSTAARAKALGRAGDLALRHQDLAAAYTLLSESLTLCRELGDERGAAFSIYGFARLANLQGDLAKGHSFFVESLTIYRKLDDKWGIALVLDLVANTVMQSDLASARMLREESLALFRELSDYWDMMRALHNSGEMARFEGDYARAKALYEESGVFGRELGVAKWDLANQLCGLGYCVLREGDHGRAASHFKESLVLQKEQGIKTSLMASSIAGLGGVAAAQGQLVRAAQLLGSAKSLIIAREAKGEYMEFQDRVEYDRDVAVVRAQLDEATFNAASEVGQQMNLDEAVVYALEELQQ